MKRFAMLFAFVASVAAAGSAFARPPHKAPMRHDAQVQAPSARGWTSLGEVRVDGGRDRDVIEVGHRAGRMSKIMLRVEDAAVELRGIRIDFTNGESITIDDRIRLREDARTSTIDLPGDARQIEKIVLRTRDLPRGGKATVEVLGLEAGHGGRSGRR